MTLPLTVACWDYDRTSALFGSTVRIEGCSPTFFNLPVEETFFRALRSKEFDVAELSLSSYTVLRAKGISPYVAIPVFMSRMFRHSAIYVRTGAGIKEPADLKGRKVGVPEYQLTAPVWVRGILEDEYGVSAAHIHWYSGGVEQPGRHEKVSISLPPGVELAPIPTDETLSQWLLDGRIDALVAPRAPRLFAEGHPSIARLFPDFRRVEQDYFRRTGIFPIMHVLGIRNELVEQYPWLPASVFKAFLQAKNHALNELSEVGALKVSLPWLASDYTDAVAAMGQDFWRYGVSGNEATLNAFLRYHHQQGLSPRQLRIDELFAPQTLEQVLI
ncbi:MULTISPECIES: ABC transporter substrate-binding protein [Burkholderiaceae]|uniref:ABC transporter substrate-binding protein n=1 Tax=Burkholderiaceae TaxID=119060 RepID=UPI0014237251|nr:MULTISPECIES: ABC transporter substrate-binding protein [Burkholderiaceae]MBN3851138.1 ABC transporter substrate-binding protein [Paraburkholderia sp. Ac-20342]NIF51258.1 ABC transporter substrate-binding protein [Burkholderia sp. Ax-1724]